MPSKKVAIEIPEHTYRGSITIDLPLPTSTNRIWRQPSRFSKSPRPYLNPTYEKWKREADGELMRQRPGKGWRTITGPFDVGLVVTLKKRFKFDLDNRIKAVLDWCKDVGLIVDDKFSNRVVIEWGEVPLGVRLTLSPAEDLS
ncbi:MAG: RusA family crossover junction endodeoxyribonuclease [Rhizobiaceae bacterium]|nr:RusA family crossover junction endodeoxyribonuclease [Rhizobiaceae bacterium]MCC0000880.1 RusA family crossover junction endodeoxyribonuclease [Methylobacteriaceae bacterium]